MHCIPCKAARINHAISMDPKQPMIANPKSAMQIWDFPSNFPYNLFTPGFNLHIPCQAPKKTLSILDSNHGHYCLEILLSTMLSDIAKEASDLGLQAPGALDSCGIDSYAIRIVPATPDPDTWAMMFCSNNVQWQVSSTQTGVTNNIILRHLKYNKYIYFQRYCMRTGTWTLTPQDHHHHHHHHHHR